MNLHPTSHRRIIALLLFAAFAVGTWLLLPRKDGTSRKKPATPAVHTGKRESEHPAYVSPGAPDVASALSTSQRESTERLRNHLLTQMRDRFDRWLDDPAAYAEWVRKDCSDFPEGNLFPHTFPALAYARLPGDDPETLRRIESILDILVPEVERQVSPDPETTLSTIHDYRDQGVFLGHLNLVLSSYLGRGGEKHGDLHHNVSRVLEATLRINRGIPLQSYPEVLWSFDTIPCLLSLQKSGRGNRTSETTPLEEAHFLWLEKEGQHSDFELPWTLWEQDCSEGLEGPRGCDLSWRITMMVEMGYPAEAAVLYRRFVQHFWLDRPIASGFAEWPGGLGKDEDFDSGPIIDGIGFAASAFGIAAARAVGDEKREARLLTQLAAWPAMRAMARNSGLEETELESALRKDDRCFTGFLFGDACLFYIILSRQ